jgi:2-polyprenyl-6-methoxyphenol hydroxylase-like FAD-dependent oxidoreductase
MPFNILINGGGIAGPCLAFWLTRQGHAVTITEQARQLRTGGRPLTSEAHRSWCLGRWVCSAGCERVPRK